jgi:hypothetical protein
MSQEFKLRIRYLCIFISKFQQSHHDTTTFLSPQTQVIHIYNPNLVKEHPDHGIPCSLARSRGSSGATV